MSSSLLILSKLLWQHFSSWLDVYRGKTVPDFQIVSTELYC